MKYIPYGKQDINQQDIDAVLEVLTSDSLTQGQKVLALELNDDISTDQGSGACVIDSTGLGTVLGGTYLIVIQGRSLSCWVHVGHTNLEI